MTAAPPDLHAVNTPLCAPSSPSPWASQQLCIWRLILAGSSQAAVESATDWSKNQMQFNPPKLCFERRTHFMRITGLRLAMLDHLGNRRWLFLFSSSCITVLALCLFATLSSSSWTPWLLWSSTGQSTEVPLPGNIVYRVFFFSPPWSLGNSGVLDGKVNWD